jgi:hypothetical protein
MRTKGLMAGAAVVAGVGAAVAKTLPDLRRYLKLRRM